MRRFARHAFLTIVLLGASAASWQLFTLLADGGDHMAASVSGATQAAPIVYQPRATPRLMGHADGVAGFTVADVGAQVVADLRQARFDLKNGNYEKVRWLAGSLAIAAISIVLLLIDLYNARRAERIARRNEVRTRYLAEHDALTGLGNRALFQQRLNTLIESAADDGEEILLFLLDLDGFKDINDTFGHDVGDEILVKVAARLQISVDEPDILVRLGGDEFAVIRPCGREPADGETTSTRLLAAFGRPFTFNDRKIHLGTSIGVARYPSDGKDVGSLLKAADLALYSAKSADRGRVEHFRPEMMTELRSRKHLEDTLRRALFEHRLELFFQPQFDLQSGRCVGAEALLRWRDETLGWVSPATFIPIAEKSGLILPIGRWVFETACRAALTWRGENAEATVAVNVSPAQFIYEDIVDEVRSVLDVTGLPPHRLELEITEGLLMREQGAAIKALEGLNDLGVRLAMDDFGTGYSSLSYLKRFPVQKLKVDRSFVHDMEKDGHDQMIVRMILDLASGLGLRTVAEGIETAEQRNLLASLGCREGQGYLFGKPLPRPDFNSFPAIGPVARSGAKTADLVHLTSAIRPSPHTPAQREAV